MPLMVSNKNEYVEALRNAPYQWQYTPVRLKRPYINKWQDNPLSLDDAAAKDGTGIGLILGELTETVAIDFDGEGTEENFQNYFGHSVDDLPESICWSSGRPHRHQRAYLVPRKWWPSVTHIQKDAAIPNIEIRWNDHQSVVVGKHPDFEAFLSEAIKENLAEAHTLFSDAAPKLAARLIQLGLDPKVKPYAQIQAIAESFRILQQGVIERENREQLKKIRTALEALEGGATHEVIDV